MVFVSTNVEHKNAQQVQIHLFKLHPFHNGTLCHLQQEVQELLFEQTHAYLAL